MFYIDFKTVELVAVKALQQAKASHLHM